MAPFGKTVKIYYKHGEITGIRVGEIINNTILAIHCSRFRLAELRSFPQTQKPGIYFLFGQDDETNRPKAYIGETESTHTRLLKHLTKKDFWNEVVLFVSKDEDLTKSHVKYLESKIMQLAKAANRYSIENSNNSNPASLPLSDRDAMEEFLLHIRFLLGAFNHLILEKRPGAGIPSDSKDMFALPKYENGHIAGARREFSLFLSDLRAEAFQTDEGLVVLKGSQAAKEVTNLLQPGYNVIRNNLIDSQILKVRKDKYVFQEDALFKSPSAAASVIVGYNINGLEVWRDFTGKTWREIEEK